MLPVDCFLRLSKLAERHQSSWQAGVQSEGAFCSFGPGAVPNIRAIRCLAVRISAKNCVGRFILVPLVLMVGLFSSYPWRCGSGEEENLVGENVPTEQLSVDLSIAVVYETHGFHQVREERPYNARKSGYIQSNGRGGAQGIFDCDRVSADAPDD